jgi:hypothetical protein
VIQDARLLRLATEQALKLAGHSVGGIISGFVSAIGALVEVRAFDLAHSTRSQPRLAPSEM